MATTLPVTFRSAPFPLNYRADINTFASDLVARMSIQSDTSFSLFTIGTTAPTTNIGPFLKDGTTWYVWDVVSGAYIPEILEFRSLRYVASDVAPNQALYTFWIKLVANKAVGIYYYSGGAWKDVYEDKFGEYSTTIQMVVAIQNAVKKYPASAKLTGNQTIPIDGALHKVLFNSAVINPDSNYDDTNSKYVCPLNGIYRVTANIQVDNSGGTSASMEMGIRISLNGAGGPNDPTSGTAVATPPGDRWYPQVDGLIEASIGDAIEVYLSAEDGVDTDDIIVAAQSQFFIELVQTT